MAERSRDPGGPNARRGTIGRHGGGSAPRRLEDTPPRDGATRLHQGRGSTRLPAPPPPVGFVSGEARPLSCAVQPSRVLAIIQKSSHLVNRSPPRTCSSSHHNNRGRARAGSGRREWSRRGPTCANALPLCESVRLRLPPAAASDTIRDTDRRSPVFVPHPLVQAGQQSSPPRCGRRGPSAVLHVAYLPCMAAACGAVQRTQPQVPSEVRGRIGANRPRPSRAAARACPVVADGGADDAQPEYSVALGMRRSAGRRRRDEAANRPKSPPGQAHDGSGSCVMEVHDA